MLRQARNLTCITALALVFSGKLCWQTTAKQVCSNQSVYGSSYPHQQCHPQWHQMNRLSLQRISQCKNARVEENRLFSCSGCLVFNLADQISKIYASIEERKQKNRKAQAAFRQHRTEYITQLENDIKRKDQRLAELQKTVEYYLMLKYKNSLLERILLEKGKSPSQPILQILIKVAGIDVETELQRTPYPETRQSASPTGLRLVEAQSPCSTNDSNKSTPLEPASPSQWGFPTHMKQLGKLNPSLHVLPFTSYIQRAVLIKDRLITEQEYEADVYADTIDGQDPGDHSAGPSPYLDSFPEQPAFPDHAYPMGSGSQSLVQPATMLQPDDSWAPFSIPTDQTFGLPASMQFPTRYQ